MGEVDIGGCVGDEMGAMNRAFVGPRVAIVSYRTKKNDAVDMIRHRNKRVGNHPREPVG